MKNATLSKLLVLFLIFLYLGSSCKKKEVPVLETASVRNVLGTTAISGGTITYDGGETIIGRGVCWSKGINPSVSDEKTLDGAGAGTFISNLVDLDPATTYYLRAYATNSNGTGYGMTMSFITLGQIPTVTTQPATAIHATSATLKGIVNSNYVSTIVSFEYGTTTSYGTAINATPNIITGNTPTSVSVVLTNLSEGTTYHYRLKASNSIGISYGSDMTFVPSGATSFSDVDGNIYSEIEIGTQTWMAENLKTTKYNDNTSITQITDNSAWISLSTPAFCWYNNDEATYKGTYGALYNWYAVNTGKLCPAGWHVPSHDDFTTLTNYLGDITQAGGKIKESGTTHWTAPNTGATNISGFTALPAGYRTDSGGYEGIHLYGIWWSSTPYNIIKPWYRSVGSQTAGISIGNGSLNQRGFSIRCVRD